MKPMKIKRKLTAAAAAFIAAANFNGCAYGPPPESEYDYVRPDSGITTGENSGEQQTETVTLEDGLEDSFEPSENYNEDVYGPPVEDIETEEDDYDPAENENEAVYGPPEDFGL